MDEASYLRSLITGKRPAHKKQETPADLVARWQAAGLLTGFGDPEKDSQEVARELRDGVSQKRVLGLHAGQTWIADDFDAPLQDRFWLGKE